VKALQNKATILKNLALSILLSLYTFRAYFYGYILGDEYDTRLMISQHEHWYRLFFKNGIFRDTLYFYPKQDALGYTDAFLIPSFFYVPFRFFDFGILQAWSLATFLTLVLGFLGWAYLIEYLIKNSILRVLALISVALYPAWVAQLEFFPNAVGYAYISWLIYLLIKLYVNQESSQFYLTLNVLIFLTLLLMLTSWYPAVFFVAIALLSLLINLTSNFFRPKRITFQKSIKKLNLRTSLLVALNLSLFSLWASIHLPIFRSTSTSRSWVEVLLHSVSFKDLVNPAPLNNGIYFLVVKNLNTNTVDIRNLGFSLALTVTFVVIGILIALNYKTWINNYYNFDKKYQIFSKLILIPALILGLIFLKLNEDFSLYKIFWSTIPGLSSIRYPYRFYFILGMILWIFIFMTLDIYLKHNPFAKNKIFIYIIFILVTLDNLKPYYSFWKAEDYLPSSLHKQTTFIEENCDYFILDRPGGWWDDATKAIALSALTGVPAANGQSSGYPEGYPVKPQLYEGDVTEMLEWAQFGISSEKGCFVSDSFTPLISEPIEPRVETYDGFSPKEGGETDYWSWATRSDPVLFVSTIANSRNNILDIQIKTPPCLQERELTFVALPDTQLKKIAIDAKSSNYSIQIPPSRYNLTKIQILTNDDFCEIENDPRDLFFEIKNYKIN
jgi:hypothetical protein